MVVDVRSIFMQPSLSRQQRSRSVSGSAWLTEGRPSFPAGQAVSATGYKGADDMIARPEVAHARTYFHDFTRSFMTKRHRHRPGPAAVDDRQIRVAQPGGTNANEHFTHLGRVKIKHLNSKRLTVLVRSRKIHFMQNGGANFHLAMPPLRDDNTSIFDVGIL
jgi:hypothetical protein